MPSRVSDVMAAGGAYRLARLLNDLGTLFSAKPERIARRAKNKVLGRALGRVGFWRRLWK
jgi:hypothetical protein